MLIPSVYNGVAKCNLGSRNNLAWQIRSEKFCKLYKKIKSKPTIYLYCLFWGNFAFHAVSCLLGFLPEPSNTVIILKHKLRVVMPWLFNVLTKTGLVAFIPARRHAGIQNS